MQVVVTGAAGLIGGEVVRRLAEAGHAVTALVHRTHRIVANDGRVVASRPWDGPPVPGTVATLAADVRAAGLGLAVDPRPDLIVNAAAITAFDALYAIYQAVNIEGTANVIGLAERRGTPLLQVSTAYVCGTREGRSTKPNAAPPSSTVTRRARRPRKRSSRRLRRADCRPSSRGRRSSSATAAMARCASSATSTPFSG